MTGRYFVVGEVGTMAQELQMRLEIVSTCATDIKMTIVPAFRFRYTEENVTREPPRTPRYAKGTMSDSQSMSNILTEEYLPRQQI